MKYIDDKIDIILTNDGSHSLYNKDLDETYHSRHGAIQESEYVYIKQGLDFIAKSCDTGTINIFELGFGTGSNFLLTINYLTSHADVCVNYTTIEKYPLSPSLIQKLRYSDYSLDKQALALYIKGHELDWNVKHNLDERLDFTKIHGDIHEYRPEAGIHLVYYDAFAPSKQQDIWDESILTKIVSSMAIGGILVTYCSQGAFKRNLKALGMEVSTLEGPPFKKEMVRAVKKEI